jgi:hypothetical protein
MLSGRRGLLGGSREASKMLVCDWAFTEVMAITSPNGAVHYRSWLCRKRILKLNGIETRSRQILFMSLYFCTFERVIPNQDPPY